jgi:hypothetical protein
MQHLELEKLPFQYLRSRVWQLLVATNLRMGESLLHAWSMTESCHMRRASLVLPLASAIRRLGTSVSISKATSGWSTSLMTPIAHDSYSSRWVCRSSTWRESSPSFPAIVAHTRAAMIAARIGSVVFAKSSPASRSSPRQTAHIIRSVQFGTRYLQRRGRGGGRGLG